MYEVNARRCLVHLLAAWAGRADKALAQVFLANAEPFHAIGQFLFLCFRHDKAGVHDFTPLSPIPSNLFARSASIEPGIYGIIKGIPVQAGQASFSEVDFSRTTGAVPKIMFMAKLVNNPTSDPALYVKLKHRQEAFLFDIGDIRRLSPRQLIRVSHLFVSHTHMDHFIGFDFLLRVRLGRDGHVSLFGPPGFIKNVEGKLAAYTWNLVGNYQNDFTLRVTELNEDSTRTRQYQCRQAFEPEDIGAYQGFDPLIVDRDDLAVRTTFLDHRVPCLAFALKEKQHINIMKNALEEMGLAPGRWLLEVKEAIRKDFPAETPLGEITTDKVRPPKTMTLGEFRDRAVLVTPGRKLAYVTDVIYSEENARKIVELAKGSDVLFIEAAFLEEDREKATDTCHLTARQAGTLARMAGAGYFRIFHISPKYRGMEELVYEEAEKAFYK